MSWFFTVKVFKIFLTFFFKILSLAFFFLKDFAILPVHGVGIFFFFLFKVAVFLRVLLFFSAKIIVQAAGHID
jgi:hypothetical protein